MPFRSVLLPFLALVLFGLGGVGAPVLHGALHSAELAAAVEAAHEAADGHAHGEGVGITGALPGALSLHEACALCQVHLASVEAAETGAPHAPEVDPVFGAGHVSLPGETSVHWPARGPPAGA